MRAVFTVDLPTRNSEDYPKDEEILKVVRSFGWEPVEISHIVDEAEKTAKYKEMATELVNAMPEIRAVNQNIIFYGYIVADETPFMISRVVTGQITFRLLQPDLSPLLTATDRIIRRVIRSRIYEKSLAISNQKIVVYERGHENIILKGRVIPNAFRETIHTDRKDFLLTIVPFAIVIPLISILIAFNPSNPLLGGTLERLSTALLTTSLVSALGLFQAYWVIRRENLISWKFTSGETASENETR